MFWAIRQLLVPMKYLYIRHGDRLLQSKAVIDFIMPGICALVMCILFLWLDVRLAIFAHEEFIKRLTDLLALLIAFYMAALAAVATFERKGIDDPLKGGDATLRVLHHDTNTYSQKALSYRQFISYLFGYLSFICLCLYIFISVVSLGWPALEKHYICNAVITDILVNIVDPVIFFLVIFFVWQLTFTSLLGIYFLTERIQSLNDPEN
jgi:hypothetical protein